MSHEDAKFKRSKRIHDKETAVKKQNRIAKEHGINTYEPHRFAKHHAMDCGNPDCTICGNPRRLKHANNLTKQERSLFQDKIQDE